MDEKTKKSLHITVATLAVSIAALLMGVLLVGISAVNGKISWVGLIIIVCMLVNSFQAYRRRKEILEYIRNQQK